VFAITHEVRARLALAEGDAAQAERWARSAVQFASETDFLGFQADARLVLAEVLAGTGKVAEAGAEAATALELYGLKADRPGADAARQLLRSASGS